MPKSRLHDTAHEEAIIGTLRTVAEQLALDLRKA
jgi:hypothetical protein